MEELPFVEPRWYRYVSRGRRFPGKYCSFHDICEQVERTLLLLDNPQGLSPEVEAALEKKSNEREIQMMEKYNTLVEEEERGKRMRKRRSISKKEEEDEYAEDGDKRFVEESSRMMDELYSRPLEQPWTIREGLSCDPLALLSSPSGKRDYLIRFKGKGKHEKVKIDQLKDKYIIFYFCWLSNDGLKPHEINYFLNEDLEELYKSPMIRGEFEVVFVALGNEKDAFEDAFSRMPWLAIPHDDQETRNSIRRKFSIPYSPSARTVLFDLEGTVLLEDVEFALREFGVEGFPYTAGRMIDIRNRRQDEADAFQHDLVYKLQKLSLIRLLGDYLIDARGEQRPTTVLDGKHVGLFFFNLSKSGFHRARELLKLWNSLDDEQRNAFQIVFVNEGSVNRSVAKTEFENELGCSIPWYSLPCDGTRLCHMFNLVGFGRFHNPGVCESGYFIILNPDKYQSTSYFAFNIIEEFRIDAYPFTLEQVVMLAKRKQQRELVLSKLLSSSAPLRRGGFTSSQEVTTVSKLSGMRVLLLFATDACYDAGSFLTRLRRMYLEKVGTHDGFEIIYISLDCDESITSFTRSIQEMPWLVHAFIPHFSVSLSEKVFGFPPVLPAIAAFGQDGHLQTKETNLALKKEWNSSYPFIQAKMDDEVRWELVDMHNWDLERLFFPEKFKACHFEST